MALRSPLYEIQKARGARFGTFSARDIVEEYEDARKEYDAVLRGVGMLDLSSTGILCATGRDRVRYLHNMLSNDIRRLEPGRGCYATLLTRQGQMESDLHVYASAEELYVECPPAGTSQVHETLGKYIVGDVVQIDDCSEKLAVLSLQGSQAREKMERHIGVSLGSLPLLGHMSLGTKPDGQTVIHRDRTGCDGYDLWLPREESVRIWTRWLDSEGIQPIGYTALNWLRTEAGIPWFGIDMGAGDLPMEFGLDSALSTTKGCYRGQEIVTRILHRGHLDRRLGAIAVDHAEPPVRGAAVRAEEAKVGEVTSAILSPRLGRPLALAVLKTRVLAPGTGVEVLYGETARRAEVVTLPLQS